MSIAPTEPATDEAGFTLVETLVALFVLAMAGVALILLQTQSVGSFSRVEQLALAGIVAENELVDLMAGRNTPDLGVREGKTELGKRSWHWRVEISPTEDPTTIRLQVKAFAPEGDVPSTTVSAFMVSGGWQ